MTARYTIKVDTSASVDLNVTLDIEAETEAEAREIFKEEAKTEITALPFRSSFGFADIEGIHFDGVADDLIEIVEVEEYEEDDDDEEDDD
jgi:hypothetical protein